MRRGRRILWAMVTTVILASCQKSAMEPPTEDDSKVELHFNVVKEHDGVNTKAATLFDESSIVSLTALLFDETGNLREYAACAGSSSLSIRVASGVRYEWHIVANATAGSSLDKVTTKSDFLSRMTELSEQHYGCTMTASGVVIAENDRSIGVNLTRMVAKVTLKAIEAPFAEFLAPELRLTKVFMINAVTGKAFSGACGEWYNCSELSRLDSSLDELLLQERDIVLSDDIYNETFHFYVMPNPIDNGFNATTHPVWCPRNTRLCLEVTVDGEPYYYAVTLPAVESNHEYIIDKATLLGLGSSVIDGTPCRDEIGFKIEVRDWGVHDTEVGWE